MPVWMKWTISLLIGFAIILIGFRYAGWLLRAFFVLNSIVLMVVVLLQSGKAADLAGAFGGAGSQTTFGPRGAASLLSQATTWCAVMFMVCALMMVLRTDKAVEQGGGSVLQNISKPAPTKPAAPPVSLPPANNSNGASSAPANSPSSNPPSSSPSNGNSAPAPAPQKKP